VRSRRCVAEPFSVARQTSWFWTLNAVGVVISTAAVAMVARFESAAITSAASLTAFAAVWVLRFRALDRIVFSAHGRGWAHSNDVPGTLRPGISAIE
jgi:hypothetical protein